MLNRVEVFDMLCRLQQEEINIRGAIGTIYENIDHNCRSELRFCLPGHQKVLVSLLQEHTRSTRHLERELGKDHHKTRVWMQHEDLVIAEANDALCCLGNILREDEDDDETEASTSAQALETALPTTATSSRAAPAEGGKQQAKVAADQPCSL